jgi:hypothetical protein
MSKKAMLKKLNIKELSLVGRPANQHAESLLHKSDEKTMLEKFVGFFRPVEKQEEAVDFTQPDAVAAAATLALHTTLDAIVADQALAPADRVAKFEQAIDSYHDAVLALPSFPSEEDMKTEVQKTAAQLEAENIAKELVTKAEKERDEALAQLKKHQEEVTKAERTRLAKELVSGTNVPETSVEKLLGGLDEDGVKELRTILGKNKVAISDGKILEELGKNADGSQITPEQALTQKAAEINKADPKLTKEQAFAKAMEANPDLYEATLVPSAAE